MLAQFGVSAYRASALARSGWLTHLARGVYMLPGDSLTRDACLAFLSHQVTGLHLGGKTALGAGGMRHTVAFRDVLSLWGDRAKPLPAWFTQRFECRYQSTQLFDASLPMGFALQPLPLGRPDVLVATPERALLELLSDVGKGQSLDEARQLVEMMHSLRSDVLETLLAHTTRIKVVRLAQALGAEFELPWAPLAAQQSHRLGGGKRWVAVSRSGERLDLKGV
ncbi:MAG: type IV toxin-antitoxin system AbiEi family antitoxin [Rhodoferax sp.]|nr:type IV toxin-antitoxin system AbiEi family antitoxin [Rhodoferax sp.]